MRSKFRLPTKRGAAFRREIAHIFEKGDLKREITRLNEVIKKQEQQSTPDKKNE